jgi:hypothetical protein
MIAAIATMATVATVEAATTTTPRPPLGRRPAGLTVEMDGTNLCRQRGCVFSIIVWIIIIVIVLALLGFFARGRR